MRLAVVVALLVGGCHLLPGTEAADIEQAKAKAARDLRDPESAQFRDVATSDDGTWVCGEINGKNAYGAYAGYQRFVVKGVYTAMRPDTDWTAEGVRGARIPCLEAIVKQQVHGGFDDLVERECAVGEKAELEYELQNKFEREWALCKGLPAPFQEAVHPKGGKVTPK